MESVAIPEEMQIDAALTGRFWNLVQRFCGGAWGRLATLWTVSFDQIVAEAERRGLENYVVARPTDEGYWLLETENGFVVFFAERGTRTNSREFEKLAPAFEHWLDQHLRSHLLPGKAVS